MYAPQELCLEFSRRFAARLVKLMTAGRIVPTKIATKRCRTDAWVPLFKGSAFFTLLCCLWHCKRLVQFSHPHTQTHFEDCKIIGSLWFGHDSFNSQAVMFFHKRWSHLPSWTPIRQILFPRLGRSAVYAASPKLSISALYPCIWKMQNMQ